MGFAGLVGDASTTKKRSNMTQIVYQGKISVMKSGTKLRPVRMIGILINK